MDKHPLAFLEQGRIYDVSRTLSSRIAVWPGDTPFRAEWSSRVEAGSSVNLSRLILSPHTGTHADAPLHVDSGAEGIGALSVRAFFGPAVVIEVDQGQAITPETLRPLDGRDGPLRVLFKTSYSAIPDGEWNEDWLPILPETVDRLAENGVVLVGTDAPSVDPAKSKTLDAHHALVRHGIVNLELLSLQDVPSGRYILLALPLKLEGLDASPVRALLIAPG